MAGVRLEGHAEVIEYVPNERIVEREFNGIQATMTWTYQPEDGGTRVNTDVEYEVPLPVLGKLAERVIVKQNHKEAQQVADNLKARMEA
jgi:carbon monoxide dehydrogenase subunit G